jgi:hypothetical protein
VIRRPPESSGSKIWSRIPLDWGQRIFVLPKAIRNLTVNKLEHVQEELFDCQSCEIVKYDHESHGTWN